MNLIDKANELGKFLEESLQYKDYKNAKDLFLSNFELQSQYEEYKNLYINYIKTKDISLSDQINIKYNELLKINDFSNYLETKKEFEELVSKINESIIKYVEYDAAPCGKGKHGGCCKR